MAASGHNIPTNITTDHIQQYLDENNSLILKILKNQNSGEHGECAENQAKLQQNLMYLAAIADCQPQSQSMQAQFSNTVMQPGVSYMQHQQSQHMMPQSLLAARSPMLYGQQQLYAAFQQQQALHSQLGMSPAGTSGMHMLHGETNTRGGTGAFPEIGCSTTGEGMQASIRRMSGANKRDGGSTAGSAEGGEGNSGQPGADKGEAFFFKNAEERS